MDEFVPKAALLLARCCWLSNNQSYLGHQRWRAESPTLAWALVDNPSGGLKNRTAPTRVKKKKRDPRWNHLSCISACRWQMPGLRWQAGAGGVRWHKCWATNKSSIKNPWLYQQPQRVQSHRTNGTVWCYEFTSKTHLYALPKKSKQMLTFQRGLVCIVVDKVATPQEALDTIVLAKVNSKQIIGLKR